MWCIINDRNEYWSNEWGWGSKKGCDLFPSTDYDLPIGGRWRRYY
jgi:hypothetical protein